MTIRSIIAIGISIAALSLSVSAQDAMERIVAVVGKEIILQSDVEGQVELLAQRNPGINKQDPKLRGLILDQLINERLIMMAAEEDTLISVSDDEISQRMEMQIGMLVQQVGSEKRLEDMYGMSMARIRREFRDEIRKQLMVEKMRQKKFGQTKAGRADVEEFYAEYKDSLPQVPERVDLYHIVRYVTVSADQSKLAYDLSLRVRDSIVKGASFGEMARRHSADLGSAVNGGDLGFVEKGKFVPAFEAAAFALEPNQISEPVETPFGWHIIQLIDKTATSINCRHILFKVGQSEDDRERTRSALTDIKKRVEAGEDFETL
ncbi:MAG: parvulin peptidyl-prolyl isomerase, partial [Ignavibacteriae bacterium]